MKPFELIHHTGTSRLLIGHYETERRALEECDLRLRVIARCRLTPREFEIRPTPGTAGPKLER